MSKKNLFLLALGYLAGSAVALKYNKKSKSTTNADFKTLVDEFIEVHSNLFEDLKGQIMTPENKKLFNEKKDELLKWLNSYKTKANDILKDLKVKGEAYLSEATNKLEDLYFEKLDEIKELKGVMPEKLEEFKEKLKETFEKVKVEMVNLKKKKK